MAEQKVKIIAECVCDLPADWLKAHNVDIVYFTIETDRGVFLDTKEITSENIISYMQAGGKKAISSVPQPEEYKKLFEEKLEEFDEVVLVSISSGVSYSCEQADKAVELLGEKSSRVHVFDSGHLSTGLGHLVRKAVEMAEKGCSASEILTALEALKSKVSTSFIAESVDYLYMNGKVSEKVKKICSAFNIHPILVMKNGELTLKSVTRGDYRKACRRYIKKTLRGAKLIDKNTAFITQAGCNTKMIEWIKSEVSRICEFENLIVTKASATVSSNCGPNTFGVLFIEK
ncbi:MAG: DegV family protein [Oscillospiraceae bacterium]